MIPYVYLIPTNEFGTVVKTAGEDAAVQVPGCGVTWWKRSQIVTISLGDYVNRRAPEAWRLFQPGDRLTLTGNGPDKPERPGAVYSFVEYSKPKGFAVVTDELGVRWLFHPESLVLA